MEHTRVAEMKVVERCGHLVPLEAPGITGRTSSLVMTSLLKYANMSGENSGACVRVSSQAG